VLYKIGLENNIERRSLAWVLDHPGCFAYGEDGQSAWSAVHSAIEKYATWIGRNRDVSNWMDTEEILIEVVETWDVYTIDEDYERADLGYEVNAWFQYDWKPLTAEDVNRCLFLLKWGRKDLMACVEGLGAEALSAEHPNERWSIAEILNHIAGAEWWYLDRLNLAFPRDQVPDDPFERLVIVRNRLIEVLPRLIGSQLVLGVEGEFWSPRKLLRRAVWHERDHTFHIEKLK